MPRYHEGKVNPEPAGAVIIGALSEAGAFSERVVSVLRPPGTLLWTTAPRVHVWPKLPGGSQMRRGTQPLICLDKAPVGIISFVQKPAQDELRFRITILHGYIKQYQYPTIPPLIQCPHIPG